MDISTFSFGWTKHNAAAHRRNPPTKQRRNGRSLSSSALIFSIPEALLPCCHKTQFASAGAQYVD
jgi:hypothetical protein